MKFIKFTLSTESTPWLFKRPLSPLNIILNGKLIENFFVDVAMFCLSRYRY
jgi:hypothetical protein